MCCSVLSDRTGSTLNINGQTVSVTPFIVIYGGSGNEEQRAASVFLFVCLKQIIAYQYMEIVEVSRKRKDDTNICCFSAQAGFLTAVFTVHNLWSLVSLLFFVFTRA